MKKASRGRSRKWGARRKGESVKGLTPDGHRNLDLYQAKQLAKRDAEVATMPMRSFGVFGPEAIAEMAETLDAVVEELRGTSQPEVIRQIIANRIYCSCEAW
jgi:hypothetical protein